MSEIQLEKEIEKTIKVIQDLKDLSSTLASQSILNTMETTLKEVIPLHMHYCNISEIIDAFMSLAGLYVRYRNIEDTSFSGQTTRRYYLDRYLDLTKDLKNSLVKVAKIVADYTNDNCIIPEKRKPPSKVPPTYFFEIQF
jgi:hypothetical protein